MRTLGIDPGKKGGLAVADGRRALVAAADVPLNERGEVDVLAVIAFIQRHRPRRAVIERASAMPSTDDGKRGMGATSAFNYGGAFHALRACVVGLGIPLYRVEASSWKAFYGLAAPRGAQERPERRDVKEAARERALAMFENGAELFPNKGHHNRAEAALIAAAGDVLIGRGHAKP